MSVISEGSYSSQRAEGVESPGRYSDDRRDQYAAAQPPLQQAVAVAVAVEAPPTRQLPAGYMDYNFPNKPASSYRLDKARWVWICIAALVLFNLAMLLAQAFVYGSMRGHAYCSLDGSLWPDTVDGLRACETFCTPHHLCSTMNSGVMPAAVGAFVCLLFLFVLHPLATILPMNGIWHLVTVTVGGAMCFVLLVVSGMMADLAGESSDVGHTAKNVGIVNILFAVASSAIFLVPSVRNCCRTYQSLPAQNKVAGGGSGAPRKLKRACPASTRSDRYPLVTRKANTQ